jgi:hypothetical protein
MTEVSYGASLLQSFGTPSVLTIFEPQENLPPSIELLNDTALPIWNQKKAPICSAIAAITLLQLAQVQKRQSPHIYYAPFTYGSALKLVNQLTNLPARVRQQASIGVPLAAAVQGLCTYGVVEKHSVLDDNYVEFIQFDMNNFDHMARTEASLPWPVRAFRLYPSIEQVRLAIFGGFAVAFLFQIDREIDYWMRHTDLQVGSRFILPRPSATPTVIATHACVIVGADDSKGLMRVRNSYGKDWGDNGYFWIEYSSLLITAFTNNEFFVIE